MVDIVKGTHNTLSDDMKQISWMNAFVFYTNAFNITPSLPLLGRFTKPPKKQVLFSMAIQKKMWNSFTSVFNT